MREHMENSGIPVFAAFLKGTSRGEPVLRSVVTDFFKSFEETWSKDLKVTEVMREIDTHCANETREAWRATLWPFQRESAEP